MKGFLYLLLSEKDKRTYLGSTNNLSRRVAEHMSGKVNSTKYRRPLKLVCKEHFDSLSESRKRERYLKSRKGRLELSKIFENL